jgi:hypothetical protein
MTNHQFTILFLNSPKDIFIQEILEVTPSFKDIGPMLKIKNPLQG